jgi:cytoskeleton protein RodZ
VTAPCASVMAPSGPVATPGAPVTTPSAPITAPAAPAAASRPPALTAPVSPTPAPVTVRQPVAVAPSSAAPNASPIATRPSAPAAGTSPAPEASSGARVATPAIPAPSPTPSLDLALGSVSSPYRLVARANETTWIRVRTEDGRTSEETVPGGEIREWVSDRPFVVTVGNAGGVSLELNGRALPPLGPRGVVIPRLVVPPDAR